MRRLAELVGPPASRRRASARTPDRRALALGVTVEATVTAGSEPAVGGHSGTETDTGTGSGFAFGFAGTRKRRAGARRSDLLN